MLCTVMVLKKGVLLTVDRDGIAVATKKTICDICAKATLCLAAGLAIAARNDLAISALLSGL